MHTFINQNDISSTDFYYNLNGFHDKKIIDRMATICNGKVMLASLVCDLTMIHDCEHCSQSGLGPMTKANQLQLL